jgi:hypothetical protein
MTERQQFLHDVMCTAFEGGCNYWAEGRNVERDAELNYLSYELRGAGSVDEAWHKVTPQLIDLAIQRVLDGSIKVRRDIAAQFVGYPNNIDMTEHDAEGADVAVQVVCFGEIVYG